MKSLTDYLNDANQKIGTDYQIAKRLGISQTAIIKARRSGSMNPDNIVKLAGLLGVNPAEIHAACDVARNPENAKIWSQWVAASLSGLAILAVVVLGENPANSMDYAALLPLPFYRLCAVMY